jgi:hypothetical protein
MDKRRDTGKNVFIVTPIKIFQDDCGAELTVK